MSWHTARLTAYDCETTGVDVETDRIVSAAIALCGGGQVTETLTLLADPGIEIPEEASSVHGITTERARAEGQPAREVIAAILEMLRVNTQGHALVVMNAPFDLTILDREARRHGLEPLGDHIRVVDPYVTDKHLDRFRRGSRKLEALCAHYRVRLDVAHDADSDAIAAARLAYAIGSRGQIVRSIRNGRDVLEKQQLEAQWEAIRHDLDALHEAQIAWAAEQAAGLEEYFRRHGKAQTVARDWPLIPFADEMVAAA